MFISGSFLLMFDDGMARRTGVLGGPGKQRKGLVGGMLSFDTRRVRARLCPVHITACKMDKT